MRIHHWNCGTMRPPTERLVNGAGAWFGPGRMVCHCLLIESPAGLVLVDSGYGLADVADPTARLGRAFVRFVRPTLDAEETAARRVERLGYRREDVRHVVLTHMDLDHAGGLSDFPHASVHVFAAEHAAAQERATLAERQRYRPKMWAHAPRWTLHQDQGDRWHGFAAVRALPGGGDEILLVPLHGHTRGHCGVAVRADRGWLLHAGDAYFHRDEIHRQPARCPPGLALFQRALARDDDARRRNQARLAQLSRERGGEITIFSAHDPEELPGSPR